MQDQRPFSSQSTGILAFLCLWLFIINTVVSVPQCSIPEDCGYNAECVSGACQCREGFTLSDNSRDCTDRYCTDPACIECYSGDTCRRCVGYIESGTGRCMDGCEQGYRLVIEGPQVGRVCPVSSDGVWSSVYTTAIVASVAFVFLLVIAVLACYWKLRSDKERKLRFEVMNKQLQKSDHKESQLQLASYDNAAYDSVSSVSGRSHLKMLQNMTLLRGHRSTLDLMYTDAKVGVRKSTERTQTGRKYRQIVYHLSRVLTLLDDHDPDLNPDTGRLLDWAVELMYDYITQKKQRGASLSSNGIPRGSPSTGHSSVVSDTPFITGSSYNAQQFTSASLSRLTSVFPRQHSPVLSDGMSSMATSEREECGIDTLYSPVSSTLPRSTRPHYTTRLNDLNTVASPSDVTLWERKSECSTFKRDREVGEISGYNLHGDIFTKPVNV